MFRPDQGSEPPAMTPIAASATTSAAPAVRTSMPAAGAPRRGAPRRWLWPIAAAGALTLAAGALALANSGELLERILAPLAAVQLPFIELAAVSRGDGPDGVEYVLFLREGAEPSTLAGFFRDHPTVRYVSPGLLPGVAVVHIRGELAPALAALRTQPQVRLALKSRLGMVCH